MLDLTTKTFQNILASMLLRISGGLNKREGSLIRTSLAAAAWAIEGIYIELANIQKQSFGIYATGDYLDYKAAERGLTRKNAVASVRRGRFNSKPAIGNRFAAKDVTPLLVYVVSTDPEYKIDAYEAQLTCETAGVIGDSYTGDLVSLDYVEGLTVASVDDILIPGSDIETDDSFRARYVESMSSTPFGGNIDAYRAHILSLDNVGAVQVFPTPNGAGTVRCVILDANMNIASEELLKAVQIDVCPKQDSEYDQGDPSSYGFGFAPIGAYCEIRTGQNVYIDICANLDLHGTTLDAIKEQIKSKIFAYIDEVKKSWGIPVSKYDLKYDVTFYAGRITSELMSIQGVKNASSVTINDKPNSFSLDEDYDYSQVPFLRRIDVNGSPIYIAEGV